MLIIYVYLNCWNHSSIFFKNVIFLNKKNKRHTSLSDHFILFYKNYLQVVYKLLNR